MKLAIADIEIVDRLRDPTSLVVDTIAHSFKSEGQLKPVLVRMSHGGQQLPKPRLVAGCHRIEAAKQIGWTHIEAKPVDLSAANGDPELEYVLCRIAEVDENLARGELDQAQRVIFFDERVLMTAERLKLQKAFEAKKAQAEAKTKAERDAAAKRAKRAELAAKKATPASSLANEQPGADRLPNEVVPVVAKELGVNPSLIHNARNFVNKIGRDDLKVMSGTLIGTQSEMQAMIKLKKIAPKEAERCIRQCKSVKEKGIAKNAKPGMGTGLGFAPSGRLGAFLKADKAEQKRQAMKSIQGKLEVLKEAVTKAEGIFRSSRIAWNGLPIEIKGKIDHQRIQDQLGTYGALLKSFLKAEKPDKPNGHEHRYKAPGTDELSKQEVRADLKKRTEEIAKVIKAKKSRPELTV